MTGAQLERGGSPTKAPPRLTAHPRGSRLLTLRAAFSSVLLLLLGFLAISAVGTSTGGNPQPIFLDSISYTTLTTDCNYLDQYFYGTQLIHKSRLDICGNTFTETLFYHTECYGAPVFSLKTSGYIYQTGFELDAGNFQLALSSLTVNASSAAGLRAVQDYCNVSSGYKQVVDVSTTGCPGLGIAPLSDCPMRFVSISSYDVATVSHLLLSAEPFVLASCSLPYTSSSVHGREAYTSNYDVCPYPSDGPFNVFKSMASLKYATEGDAVSATIRRWSGPVDIPFEINCTVSEEETTAAPGDYVVLSSLVLSFGSGVLSQDVSVSFPQNAAPAMTRKLVLECASSAATVHAASGSSERIEIVLFDDDTDLFSFATPSVNSYPDRAGSVLVERTPASPESGTVQYYFVLDDIAPEDFSDSFPLSGEIEFGPGQESFLFELPMPAYNFDAHAPYIYSMHLNASANSVGTHSVLEVSVGGAYDPGTPYFQNVDHPLVLGETIYISSSFDSEFSFFQPFTCKWRLSDDSWTGAPASETFEVVSGIFSWEYSYSSPAVTLVVLPAETTLSKHFQLVPFDCLGSSVSDGSDGVQVAIQYQGLVPSIRLLADNYQASVWEGSIQVNVALSSALEEDATFPWEIVPDTAVADEDYSPANGLILFSAGSTEATVEITLPPNSSPSYGKSFTFRLMTEDPSFAVVAIDLPNAMLVEIYAHDNPDGEFTFSNVTAQTIPEGQSWSVELVRSVNWTLPVEIVLDDHFHERRKDSTSASTTRSNRGPRSTRNVPQPGRASRPNGELEPTLGRKASLRTRRDRDVVEEDARLQLSPNPVVFLPGETTKTITITALDDDRPEWDEYYPVYMQTFSIDTVGAAASPEQEILVLVPENDDPHGTFTIEQGVSTPVGTFLAINLHRDGQMPSNGVGYNVYYEIIPMTALPGVDYLVPENNYTVFDGNVWSLDTSIQIQILDTGLPAQDKFFEVRLLSIECPCVNPVIFPHISQVANSTVVRIEAQNGANGHFAFDDFSPRAINVTEGGVSLTVVRTDALYGACNLTISSTGQASLGYDFTSDPIQFVDGQATSTLYLQFIPQMDPVITRTAEVYLSGSCSGATLDSTPVTIIFPVANNPFGVFQIEQRDYPFETFGSYDIAVTRAWTSLGAVQINYEIFDSEGESPSDIQDNSGGSITMEPYQSYAYISFQYVDVSASQPRRTFFVNITSITKTDDPDPEPLSAPVIGVGLGQYWLAPTGTAGGDFVLQQISPLDLVKGGPPQPFRVDRLNSASGNVTVYLYFYSPVPFILTDQLLFVDGETTKTGYIQAVDDGRDSNAVAESLSIDHIDGIATSYTSDTLNVTIARDGFPGGTFFIAPVSQNMTVDRLAPVDLLILRAGDRAGEVKVWLNVVGTGDEHTAAFDTDYTLAPNPVTLAPFQAAGVVTLSWPISESPMPYQNIQLGIVSLTSADSELSPTYLESATAMLTVLPDEYANGLFAFDLEFVSQSVSSSGDVTFTIFRSVSTVGAVYVTILPEADSEFPEPAVFGEDVIGPENPIIVTFADGQQVGEFTVTAVMDSTPQVAKRILFRIANVTSADGLLINAGIDSDVYQATLDLEAHDYPHGVFGFLDAIVHVDPFNSTILTLTIKRDGGSIGGVRARVSTATATFGELADPNTDFVSVDGMLVEFADGQTEAQAQITLLENPEPHPDLNFLVVIDDVTLKPALPFSGAVPELNETASSVQVVIRYHDLESGTFQFSVTSASVNTGSGFWLDIDRIGEDNGDVVLQITPDLLSEQYPLDLTNNLPSFLAPMTVSFADAQLKQSIYLSTLSSIAPSVDSSVSLILTVLSHQYDNAAIGTNSIFKFTVLAHDDPHGTIGFNPSEYTGPEGTMVAVRLERFGGLIGAVTASFTVSFDGASAADIQVSPATSVTFADGESEQFINVTIVDDHIPEELEVLQITISDLVVDLESTGATPHYGQLSSQITIPDNDQGEYGTVFFASELVLAEEGASAVVTVTRVNGSYGAVAVALSASGNAESPSDYTLSSYLVSFADGEVSQNVTIDIIADGIPELQESIYLELQDPEGGVAIGSPSSMEVRIAANDNAYGTISFAADSETVTVVASETDSVQVTLNVTRTGGTIGKVRVRYSTVSGGVAGVGPASSGVDYTAITSNEFVMLAGASTAQITVTILANNLPTLDVGFLVFIEHVEIEEDVIIVFRRGNDKPDIGSRNASAITIAAHNDPNGVFEFATTGAIVQSTSGTYTLIVRRTGGTIGTASLSATASVSGQQYPIDLVQDASLASPLAVSFGDGSSQASAIITIVNNGLPRVTSTAVITLSIGSAGAYGRLGTNTTFTLTIPAHNNPHGIVSFGATSQSVSLVSSTSSAVTVQLNVTRTGGSIGALTVLYNTVSGGVSGVASATAGTDYVAVASGSLSLADGVSSGSIVITLPANSIPTLDVGFQVLLSSVSLTSLIGTGAVPTLGSGAAAQGNITIAAHNDPNGVFEFATTGAIVQSTSESYTLVVRRTGGTIGTASLSATASVSGQQYPIDLVLDASLASPLSVTFGDGSSQASTFITILNNGLPRVTSTAVITLSIGSAGAYARLGTNTTFTLTIPAHNNPHGAVSFAAGSQALTVAPLAGAASSIQLNLTRTGGSIGTLVVTYQTSAGGVAGIEAATAGEDFTPIVAATVTIPAGSASAFVMVTIPSNVAPELDRGFQVLLTNVAVSDLTNTGATPSLGSGAASMSNVTLSAQNDPNGVFEFAVTSVVADSTSGSYLLVVHRSAGTVGAAVLTGTASVSGQQYPLDLEQDVSLTTPLVFNFADGATTASASIVIVNNGQPRVSSTAVLTLAITSAGSYARLGDNTTVLFTIPAHNNPHGTVSFGATSQSVSVASSTSSAVTVQLNVTRTGGSIGALTVLYNTVSGGVSGVTSATAGTDYVAVASGSLSLADGVSSGSIVITLPANSIPTLDVGFRVLLSSVSLTSLVGTGAVPTLGLGAAAQGNITIAAHNDPNGVFEFATTGAIVQSTSGTYTLIVRRTGGTIGTASLSATASVSGQQYPIDLVQDASLASPLAVSFGDGSSQASAIITIVNNGLPRVTSTAVITLSIGSAGAYGRLGTNTTFTLTIPAHNNPHGIVSFGATSQSVSVVSSTSSAVTVQLNVTRTGGSIGALTVLYNTVSGGVSGVASATAGTDYVAVPSGSLSLADGVSSGSIVITLPANSIPTLDVGFQVLLSSVSLTSLIGTGAVPTLGSGAAAQGNITIAAHNDPNGVFEFATTGAIVQSTSESYTLVVRRTGGTIGTASLSATASVSGQQYPIDLVLDASLASPLSVTFGDGSSQASTFITILNNGLPRVTSTAVITLSIGSAGAYARLGTNTTFTLTIPAHNNPHGAVSFAAGSQALTVAPLAGAASSIQLNLTRTGGSIGTLVVTYQTSAGGVAGIEAATAGEDFTPIVAATVTIPAGSASAFVMVTIPSNVAPELDRGFQVLLTNVAVSDLTNTGATPSLGSGAASMSNVTLSAQNDPNGVFEFAVTSVVADSTSGSYLLVVHRSAGTVGAAVLTGTASVSGQQYPLDLEQDVSLTTPLVFNFADGATTASASIVIVNNGQPRVSSTAVLTLAITSAGSYARLGDNTTVLFTIPAHNNPHGTVSFGATSQSVSVASSTSSAVTVQLNVTRTGGSIGALTVLYNTVSGGVSGVTSATAGTDYVAVASGSLSLADGVSSGSIVITLPANSIPTLDVGFRVLLSSVSLTSLVGTGAVPTLGLGAAAQGNITIAAHNDPNGVFEFATTGAIVQSTSGTYTLIVRRTGGTIGTASLSATASVSGQQYPIDLVQDASLASPLAVSFGDGSSQASAIITIVNNGLPRVTSTAVITLSIGSAGAYGRLGTNTTFTLTIPAHNNPHGIVSFGATSQSVSVVSSTSSAVTVQLNVTRTGGSIGALTVLYNTVSGGVSGVASATAGTDYVAVPSGSLSLADGVSSGSIVITLPANSIPTLDVGFQVLLSSVSLTSLIGTGAVPTLGSGAAAQGNITIAAHNDPNGVFEFATTGAIVQSTSESYTLVVRRTGGTIGTASLSATASVSGQQYPIDLVLDASLASPLSVTFGDGSSQASTFITILNNGLPRVTSTAVITLSIGSAGAYARLGTNTTFTLTIPAHNNPHGAVSFAAGSQALTVAPLAGAASSIQLNLTRTGGSIGTLVVTYQTSAGGVAGIEAATAGEDFTPIVAATVTIPAGSASAFVMVTIPSNVAPELDRGFQVLLTNVAVSDLTNTGATPSLGSGAASMSNVTLSAQNDPNGVFEFAVTSVVADSTSGSYLLVVHRSAGTVGAAVLTGTASVSGQQYPLDLEQDVSLTTPLVFNFADGATTASASIVIVNNGQPRVSSTAVLTLAITSAGSYARLGDNTTVLFTIPAHNNPHGTVSFGATSQSVSVASSTSSAVTVQLNVTRTGGSIGALTVLYNTVSGGVSGVTSATAGTDYVAVASGSLSLADGVSSGSIVITLPANSIPTLDVGFRVLLSSVSLTSLVGTGAVPTLGLGAAAQGNITIAAHNDPNGVFEFATTGAIVQSTSGTYTLIVRRTGGTIGTASLSATASVSGQQYPIDLVQDASLASPLAVSFGDGSSQASAIITIVNNGLPRVTSTAVITLSIGSAGAYGRLGTNTTFTLTIPAHNNPHGIVSFGATSQSVSVVSSTSSAVTVQLNVTRTGGSIGALTVLYNTVSGGVSGVASATAGTDYVAVPSGSLSLADGVSSGSIVITLPANSIPTLDVGFQVLLSSVSLTSLIGTGAVPTLGSGAAAQGNITIAAHNDPNGVFEFATTGAIVQSTSESYTLVVRRTGGTIGTASLSATASVSGQQYPIDLVLDASLASPLSVTFGDGSSQASTFITILNNGLPRVTSTAVITLSIGSAGAYARLGTNTTFTLTIPAHDNPFGTVSFSSDSQALSLQQSAFLLTLNITRQGGTFGDIDLVFSTRNPTNAGLLPAVPSVDYQPLSSVTLRLVSGQSRSFVSVMILADTTPSFDEAFEVVLVSVSTPSQSAGAVPSVGVNNVALVTLLSHHYPSGVFAVATPNLFGIQSGESIPASFVQQVQSGSVVVVVQRGAGALDEAVVSWTLSPPSSRLSPTSGALVFAAGQREAQAVLSIVASPVPAVSSTIDFSIFSVTPAVTSLLNTSAALSRVVIVGNGDPFGVFTPQDARVTVATGAQTVTVVINRSQGALEPIEVRYSTAVIPNVDRREIALRPALADVDFVPVTNQKLTFAAGQTSASVQIALLGSSRPHLALGFKVVLVSAQRVGELSSTVPTPGGMLSSWDSLTSPRISADPATMVVIPASNAPTGSFVFDTSSTSVQVSNTSSSVSVRVSRLGGSTGSVTLGVNASSFDARPSVDFKLITTTLTFAAGDTSANATISILAAAFPKAAQTITLKLSVLTTMVDGSVVVLPDPVALLGSPSTSLLLLSQYGRPGVCESQTVGNYSWPETLAGGSAIVPCEFGFVGNASRQCLSGQLALWATADVSGCRDVQSLLSDLLSVPVTEDSLQLLAENANTMSTQVGALDEGALGSLATLLSEMSAVGASAGWPGQSSYNMMSVFDNLLGSSSAGLAAYQGGNSGANNLANVLTNFGYSLLGPSPTAGTTVTRSGENAIISASAVSVGSDANFTTSSGGNFSLPGSLFDMLNGQEVQGLFAVSFALYQTSDLFPAVNQTNSAVSNVISASVQGREVYNLTEPVTFVISHAPLPTPPTCTFYNFATQQWDAEGCVTSRLSSTSTQCQCYHLTNFALFFSLGDDEIDSISADILSNITYIGCALSIFGTVVTFMTFVLLKTLRTFAMKLVMHLCVAVFGINVVFLAGATQTGNQDQCKATGIFLHFFLLCSFCWMLSLGVNLYLGIVRLNTDTYIYYKHMLIASYGVPTLIVVITMAVDIDNYGGTEACWIQDQNALIGAFYVPVLLVIAANIFMFIKIVIAFQRAAKDRRILGAEERNNLRVLVTIFLMLGITWVFGVLAIDSATTALQYLFVIFNSFQGFFIFVFYCLNQRVLQAYRATLGGRFPFSYISSLAARTSQTSAGSSSAATAASSVGERPASSTSSYFSSLPTTSKEAGYASGTFSSTTDSMHDGGESGTQSHSSGGRGSKEARRVATLPGSATGTALDNSFVRQSEAAFTGLRRQLDADRAASPSRLPASLPTTAHPSTAIEMQQIVAPRPVAVQPAVSTRPARTLSPRDLKRLDTIDFSNV